MANLLACLMYGLYVLVAEFLITLAQTTLPPTTPSSPSVGSEAPIITTTTTAAPTTPEPGRSFDGVSFIGGIIFSCCCLVAGLVVYKFCFRKKPGGENYGVF